MVFILVPLPSLAGRNSASETGEARHDDKAWRSAAASRQAELTREARRHRHQRRGDYSDSGRRAWRQYPKIRLRVPDTGPTINPPNHEAIARTWNDSATSAARSLRPQNPNPRVWRCSRRQRPAGACHRDPRPGSGLIAAGASEVHSHGRNFAEPRPHIRLPTHSPRTPATTEAEPPPAETTAALNR